MSFYAKACFVIAVVAVLGIPFSYFAISKQNSNSVAMEFEVLRTDTEFVSHERRTVGRVFLKGTHPEKGPIETQAQVGAEEIEQFAVGSTIPGRYIETDKDNYAHIGQYAERSPFSAMPMFGGIALVFGIIGFVLARKGGG